MPINFLETIKNYFTSQFTEQASSTLGETSSAVSKAITAIIPTALAGIYHKATSGAEGANEVFETAKNSESVDNIGHDVISNAGQQGEDLFSGLFQNKQTITSAVAGYSGIKDTSASFLMSMALPVIIGLLGKHASENNLSASGLAGFLSSQKDKIQQALPAGLTSIGSLFGLSSLGSVPQENTSTDSQIANESHEPVIEPTKRPNWLIPLIVIVIGLFLLWYFSRSCGETKPGGEAIPDSTVQVQKNDTASAMKSLPTDSIVNH